MKKSYMPGTDLELRDWATNFKDKLSLLKTKFGLADADVNATIDGIILYIYCIDIIHGIGDFKKTFATFKRTVFKGTTAANPSAVPAFTPAAPPVTLIFGFEKKIRKIVKQIKAHPNYSLEDGEELGIIGDEITPESMANWQLVLSAQKVANRVKLTIDKQGHIAPEAEIEVDRDGSGFQFLTFCPATEFIDPFPLNSVPQPTTFHYRAKLRVGGVSVGIWSEVLIVAVP
ncbi:MAG: hypothetical protein NTX03_01430 [Bacteroidetes bacterium]|nr:hypothetical protein [Bacteroidota bacterium]